MTAYIERIITEVEVQQESSETGEATDQRWIEAQKIEAAMKRQQVLQYRTHAEGLDD